MLTIPEETPVERTDRGSLLRVEGLSIRFPSSYGATAVLDDIDLEIRAGESIGLVGESGSGKSLLGLSIMGLLPHGAVRSGRIAFRGEDLARAPERRLRRLRGREIAMVYQDALTSLDPSFTVGHALSEVIRRGSDRSAHELLDMVALHDGERMLRSYPHELSGGQRQRVLIALALSRRPSLVIADEPTTALDVTVQAQITKLLRDLQEDVGFALLLISHDLGLVAQVADRVAVMYAGQLIEGRPAGTLLSRPRHPYSRGLLNARLSLEQRDPKLHVIPGVVPAPRRFPSGCRFRDRCVKAQHDCAGARPPLVGDGDGVLACYHPLSHREGSS
ncbi:MAG: peptide/nickel transport system ATP-binding protein [Solirubrobacteraceae bacterium]